MLSSLPCTAGCPWWHINERRPQGKQRRREHLQQFRRILAAWLPVAREIMASDGSIVWEWPRGCSLWRDPAVVAIIKKFGLTPALFDGCAYGLRSESGQNKGLPIHKPWTLATNCPAIYKKFHGKRCPGKHAHPKHAPCAGRDTSASAFYPRRMAVDFHKAWMEHCRQREEYYALPAVGKDPPPQLAASSARPEIPSSGEGVQGTSSSTSLPPALAGEVVPESSAQQVPNDTQYYDIASDAESTAGNYASGKGNASSGAEEQYEE